MTDSDSSIDTSVWLPRDASVVKAERVAKGDIDCTVRDGRIATAQVVDRSALAQLVKSGALDDAHAYYAAVFRDLREAFLRRLSRTANPIYASEFFGADGSGGLFETMYLKLCRELPKRAEGLIRHAIDTWIEPELLVPTNFEKLEFVLYWKRPSQRAPIADADYRAAFDALARGIDSIRDRYTCTVCDRMHDPVCKKPEQQPI